MTYLSPHTAHKTLSVITKKRPERKRSSTDNVIAKATHSQNSCGPQQSLGRKRCCFIMHASFRLSATCSRALIPPTSSWTKSNKEQWQS